MTIRNLRKNLLVAIVSSSLLAGVVIAIPFVANAMNGSTEKVKLLEDTDAATEDKQRSDVKSEMKQERGKVRHFLGSVMESLGIEKADIETGIRNGSTLGEVAESKGISNEDLASAITSIMTEKLNEAVAEGKITADEALAKADNIQERAQQLINKPLDQKPGKGHNHRGKVRHLPPSVALRLKLRTPAGWLI